MPNPKFEQIADEMELAAVKGKLYKAQAEDAYRQLQQAFINIREAEKSIRDLMTVVDGYRQRYGSDTQITFTMGNAERRLSLLREWMADNPPF